MEKKLFNILHQTGKRKIDPDNDGYISSKLVPKTTSLRDLLSGKGVELTDEIASSILLGKKVEAESLQVRFSAVSDFVAEVSILLNGPILKKSGLSASAYLIAAQMILNGKDEVNVYQSAIEQFFLTKETLKEFKAQKRKNKNFRPIGAISFSFELQARTLGEVIQKTEKLLAELHKQTLFVLGY